METNPVLKKGSLDFVFQDAWKHFGQFWKCFPDWESYKG